MVCPKCGKASPRYDGRRRQWRHLDTCQLRTILEAEVPRIECGEHGVTQVSVPWAEPGSRFTALFECVVIDWLREASLTAVAVRMELTWDEVDGIQERAVRRGLARRAPVAPQRIGVDETSFQKRHEYVTVVVDLDEPRVLHVADSRKKEALDGFYGGLSAEKREAIRTVAMDMWGPYIASTMEHVPNAGRKIAFDKFHVAQLLGEAVDEVRRRENRDLLAMGQEKLKGTRYLWLTHPANLSREQWTGRFAALRRSTLKTARAWALKEEAMGIWRYATRGWAERGWKAWLAWALRSRLEPVKRAARTVRSHLAGILNAVVQRATNAAGESINAGIQRVKRMACGFRNRDRFRRAIYFHLGGLDLYPALPEFTHTNSGSAE